MKFLLVACLLFLPFVAQGLPQYSPQDPAPAIHDQQHSQDPNPSGLTPEQIEGLNQFWWLQTQPFKPPGSSSGGTIVSVSTEHQPGAVPIPHPAPSSCSQGFDCVPWHLCIDGVISTSGAHQLDLRVQPLPPPDLPYDSCGPEGSVCCAIPEYPVEPPVLEKCSAGLVCVEESQCNLYTGFIGERVAEYDGKPLVEHSFCETGTLAKGICCQEQPDHHNEGRIDPTGGAIGELNSQCEAGSDCVPYFQCDNDGNIITDGSQLIDIRTASRIPRKRCENPQYADVPAFCCRIPGYTPPPEPCPPSLVCISGELCDAGGSVITDGSGIIDLRSYINQKCSYDGTHVGVCCYPPIPVVNSCPGKSVCIPPDQCHGTALSASDAFISYTSVGSWTQCQLSGYGSPGVCCENPPPVVDYCPDGSVCLDSSFCKGQAYNAQSSLVPYAAGGDWTQCVLGGAHGVCCENPPVEYCPAGTVCLPHSDCNGHAYNAVNSLVPFQATGGSWTQCLLNGYGTHGVCCENPPPVVDYCPAGSVCLESSFCKGQAYNALSSLVPYAAGGDWTQCVLGGAHGVCCENPPIEHCPAGSVCLSHSHCSGTAYNAVNTLVPFDTTGDWAHCTLGGEYGVCCVNPPVEYCPSGSVCLPHSVCKGDAYNAQNSLSSYSSTGDWIQCKFGDDLGVCCVNPVLEVCPAGSVCLDNSQCAGEAYSASNQLVPYDSSGQWAACKHGQSHGICCAVPEFDTCPGVSVCIPGPFCPGKALNTNNNFSPYSPEGSWAHCHINGIDVPGVCCGCTGSTKITNQCGVPGTEQLHTRIQGTTLGITQTKFGEFPWQAIVFFRNFTFKCGATIISQQYVLTAAHCVKNLTPYDIRIRVGEWQVNSFDEPLPYVDAEVSSIKYHDDFVESSAINDIAVIKLKSPLVFGCHINSVCLPPYGTKTTLPPGKRCIATGWGKDAFDGKYQHIMKRIDLPIVPNAACQELLRKTRLGKYFRLHPSFMCAGGEENKDACRGDGGGPLACRDDSTGHYTIVGITSWGIGCGVQDVPGVYADVQYFRQWIADATGLH